MPTRIVEIRQRALKNNGLKNNGLKKNTWPA
jgi:hypothetical protein